MKEYRLLLSEQQYTGMTTVIANLENKLWAAQAKHPDKSFKEQEWIVSALKDYHFYCMELSEENRIMDKKYIAISNKCFNLEQILKDTLNDLKKLRAENEQLKTNIP